MVFTLAATTTESTKKCCICGTDKSFDAFSQRAGKAGKYLRSECKKCRSAKSSARNKERWRADPEWRTSILKSTRANFMMRNYGITKEDFDAIVEAQGGGCAICRDVPTRWHIDHDHITGKVRGALCPRCNLGLGYFRDNPGFLGAAARYIETSVEV